MSLDDKVNLILIITGTLLVSQFLSHLDRMSREDRKSEIESMRLLIPLGGTIFFAWKFLRGSEAAWVPLGAIVSLAALIYGVVRVGRQPRDG